MALSRTRRLNRVSRCIDISPSLGRAQAIAAVGSVGKGLATAAD
jgi:hypothetical protein